MSRYSPPGAAVQAPRDVRAGSAIVVERGRRIVRPARRSRCRRPVSCPRRSEPTGSAQSMPGSREGGRGADRRAPAPGRAEDAGSLRSAGTAARRAILFAASMPAGRTDDRPRLRARPLRSAAEVTPSARCSAASCSMRDGARLEQPAQIGRQIGERRLEEHPGARVVHVAQPLEHVGARVRRRIREERSKVGVRGDAARPRTSASAPRRTAADSTASPRMRRERRELLERLLERNRRGPACVGRNRRASLSARQARAAPASARPWSRSAGWPPATRRCRL